MKWTIITTPQFHSHKKDLLDFFQSKKTEAVSFDLDAYSFDKQLSSETVFLMTSISKQLEISDFFVCVASADEMLCPVIMFALGYARALALPSYFIGENKRSNVCKDTKDIFFYLSLNEFLENIQKEYPLIEKRKKNTVSQRKICEMGLPFSINGFSKAIHENNHELCDLYFASGLDLNGRDSSGTPLLNNAIRSENYEISKKLLKYSVDINIKSLDRGYSPLMDAVWKSHFRLVKLLIEAGADLNHVADDGQSVLILATGIDNYDICEILIKAGANSHIKDKMGMSALDYARLFKREHLVALYEKEGL